MAWLLVIVVAGAIVVLWMRKRWTTRHSRLMKEATALKRAGDLEGAIATLRRAFGRGLPKPYSNPYGLSDYLRLPAYLGMAGKAQEGWAEYERLLGYCRAYPPELAPMLESDVYDKMRLFLQRQNRPAEAVAYGVLTMLSWDVGLCMQKRRDERIRKSDVVDIVKGLAKKAKRTEMTERIVAIAWQARKESPRINLRRVGQQVSQELGCTFDPY